MKKAENKRVVADFPIIVTGPQRAGSRIAAHMLASDLGGVFVDELDYCLPLPDNAVVQAPFLLKAVVELSFLLPGAKFAFIDRRASCRERV